MKEILDKDCYFCP